MTSKMNLMNAEEIIKKKVSKCGTGAAAYAPRKWLGREIFLVLPREEKKTVEKKIMDVLQPNLAKIEGIFLYGSHARNEQTKDSDIDVMVVATEPFKVAEHGMDFIVVNRKLLVEKIKESPAEYYMMVQEARPILNKGLLEEMKKIKIENNKLLWIRNSGVKPLKYVEELIEVDIKKKSKYLTSQSVVYSLFLRARGAYIAKCIINGRKYSVEKFRKHLSENHIDQELYGRLYSVYALEREDKKSKIKITIDEIQKLLWVVKKELQNIKVKTNVRQKEAS